MKKFIALITSSLISGCSPFPIHYDCDLPKFSVADKVKHETYFDQSGYFEKFCSEEVMEKFSYQVNNEIDIIVRVREEWLDLKPLKNNVAFKLASSEIRDLNFAGYTQAIRIDALKANSFSATLPDSTQIDIAFNLAQCTCVTYDAI